MSIQEPSNNHKDRVQNAKDRLRDDLQDCFEETSGDCSDGCRDYNGKPFLDHDIVVPGSYSDDGHRIIRFAVREWRQRSWECIKDGFWSLRELANELERDPAKSAATAKDQTWDVIDEFFQWTKTDRKNPLKFKEWQRVAVGHRLPLGEVMQMRGKCNQPKEDLHIPLHCDFLALVERRLKKLEYTASRSAPVNPKNAATGALTSEQREPAPVLREGAQTERAKSVASKKPGRHPKFPEFAQRAGKLWFERERADSKSTQLRKIASELDAKGYKPPAKYLLEKKYAEALRAYNRDDRHKSVKTWVQLVATADKDLLYGMRRLLSRYAGPFRTNPPDLSGN